MFAIRTHITEVTAVESRIMLVIEDCCIPKLSFRVPDKSSMYCVRVPRKLWQHLVQADYVIKGRSPRGDHGTESGRPSCGPGALLRVQENTGKGAKKSFLSFPNNRTAG